MLLLYGIGRQTGKWHVTENKAPMFARVYSILGGKTRYRDEQTERMLSPGHLYIFPAHTPYEMTTDPDDPIYCLYLHMDIRSASLNRLVSISLEEEPEIRHLIQVIQEGIEGKYPSDYLEKLTLAFEELCELRGYIETMDAATGQYVEALRMVYRTDVKLDEIAARFGYSTEHFIRIFKKRMGVSPHQYIISLRMSDAVRMLAGSASLDEIGAAIGYGDGHSFSNAFRRYYGISPGMYRTHYAGFV